MIAKLIPPRDFLNDFDEWGKFNLFTDIPDLDLHQVKILRLLERVDLKESILPEKAVTPFPDHAAFRITQRFQFKVSPPIDPFLDLDPLSKSRGLFAGKVIAFRGVDPASPYPHLPPSSD